MAEITIGGARDGSGAETLTGDLDSFAKLQAAWPQIDAAVQAMKQEGEAATFSAFSAMIGVTAVAVGRPREEIAEKLKTWQLSRLMPFFGELMREAEVFSSGEPRPAEGAASPSTATSIA